MIIDFHTHTFPDGLAERAIESLKKNSKTRNYLSGRLSDLKQSMKDAGYDYAVLLPVVTKPSQQETVNHLALEINETTDDSGIFSFGGIHPENDNYKEILKNLAAHHIKGIKLHPVFQNTYLDDLKYLRLIDYACEQGLLVLIHAGYDIGFPGIDYATTDHIIPLLNAVNSRQIILAHMGGWGCYDEVEEKILGRDVWIDTAFSIRKKGENPAIASSFLPVERFVSMVRAHGADRILFGTDSPWVGQKEALAVIKNSGLNEMELSAVLSKNAAGLLGITS